jgi:PPK2 family polyphosphate:nucleotide phosphotransferase
MVFQDESAAIPKEKVPFAEQVERYRVPPGGRVTLADYPPDPSEPLKRGRAQKLLKRLRKRLNTLQELLYATGDRAVLVVLQGMDTSGKDGVIKRVVSAFNPQGFEVSGFKVPTPEELAHDFLWRVHARVPRRGMVGVFNRSHYEDVLVVRVDGLVPEPVWRQRYAAIREFEALLAANGVVIVKFFLNISKEEQAARLRDRLEDPTEHWKFRTGDLSARAKWDAYMAAYEAALEECSPPEAPWYVVPANNKTYRDAVIAQVLVNRLEALQMEWPPLPADSSHIVIE